MNILYWNLKNNPDIEKILSNLITDNNIDIFLCSEFLIYQSFDKLIWFALELFFVLEFFLLTIILKVVKYPHFFLLIIILTSFLKSLALSHISTQRFQLQLFIYTWFDI